MALPFFGEVFKYGTLAFLLITYNYKRILGK